MKSLRDKVRAVCHALRMHPLTGVDPSMSDGIRMRIRHLPSAEEILSLGMTDLDELRARSERLLQDIAAATPRRDAESAIRSRVTKGLPPSRPPVLAGPAGNWFKVSSGIR